jgi:Ca2+-transporting ATPase
MQLTFRQSASIWDARVSAVTGDLILYVKGAPEIVMDQCVTALTEDGLKPLADLRAEIEEQLLAYQRRGMRTLAFAYKPIMSEDDLNIENLVTDMVWLGYVAIADPIRPEVPSAVQASRDAGIKVKIVTGDNAETAKIAVRSAVGPGRRRKPGAHISGRDPKR